MNYFKKSVIPDNCVTSRKPSNNFVYTLAIDLIQTNFHVFDAKLLKLIKCFCKAVNNENLIGLNSYL